MFDKGPGTRDPRLNLRWMGVAHAHFRMQPTVDGQSPLGLAIKGWLGLFSEVWQELLTAVISGCCQRALARRLLVDEHAALGKGAHASTAGVPRRAFSPRHPPGSGFSTP